MEDSGCIILECMTQCVLPILHTRQSWLIYCRACPLIRFMNVENYSSYSKLRFHVRSSRMPHSIPDLASTGDTVRLFLADSPWRWIDLQSNPLPWNQNNSFKIAAKLWPFLCQSH